jgi:hypothetical protein
MFTVGCRLQADIQCGALGPKPPSGAREVSQALRDISAPV